MNTNHTQNGNIIVLILVAVALFGALTFTLSNSMQGGESQQLNDAQVKQYAADIISYTAQVEAAVDQMVFNGTPYADIDIILPSDANFETGSDINKLFHPDGGGVNLKPTKIPPFNATGGYVTSNGSFNFEWTPTATGELTFGASDIQQEVCAEINNQLYGDPTIPSLPFTTPVTAAVCPLCEGRPSNCIYSTTFSLYSFYSIVGPR